MTTPMTMATGDEGPIPFNLLMALREAAKQRQGMDPEFESMNQQASSVSPMQGAAMRRLEGTASLQPDEMDSEELNPEEMMMQDLKEEQDASIQPPDITQSAAQTMMRYGAIARYLMQARGEIPSA